MPPELNVKRAVFVLGKIDEILAWEKDRQREQDLRFVDLGRYLCEVRAGQYWRLDKMKSFDDFLEKRFPDCRRKAYYLMAIHENLTRVPKQQLREIGWTKAQRACQGGTEGGGAVRKCTLGAQGSGAPEGRVQTGSRATPDGEGNGTVGDHLLQAVQESVTGSREGPRNRWPDARNR